jgi:phosphate transport system protein
MKKFEGELARLKHRVVEMGTLAESMVAAASTALIKAEPAFIEQVRTGEPTLDRLQVEIDREAIRLIIVYAPVASDLRCLLMIARITSELERIGDQAMDNCEMAEILDADRPPAALSGLSEMSETALRMVHQALDAFREEAIDKAQAVIGMDDRIDAMESQTFRDLLQRQVTPPEAVGRSVGLVLVARSLERIADHATNICEEIFYWLRGEDIRHQA